MSAVLVFWKHCWKREIARNEQFLLFPQCLLSVWRTFCHFHQVWNCRLQTLSIWKSLKFVGWERVKGEGTWMLLVQCISSGYRCYNTNIVMLKNWIGYQRPVITPEILRTGLVGFPAWPISFKVLMITFTTGFMPLSPPTIVSTVVWWKRSQWLGKNMVLSTVKDAPGKHG